MLTGNILVNFIHVYREANRCADSLAKRSFRHDPRPQGFDEYPNDLVNLFVSDFSMVSTPACYSLVIIFLLGLRPSSYKKI